MPVPQNTPLTERALSTDLVDISAPSSAYVPTPWRGYLVRAYSCLQRSITGSDAHWTLKVNGTAVAPAVTVTASGSAAGDVDSTDDLFNVMVSAGDSIAFESDGASSTTAAATFTAVIRRQ